MSEWAKTKQPCPDTEHCSSSDAYAINTSGWGRCFSCGKNFKDGTTIHHSKSPVSKAMIPDLDYRPLNKRGISQTIAEKFGYGYASLNGKTVQVAPYYNSKGQLVAQKIRFSNKNFLILGSLKDAALFGQNLWRSKGGKRVVITEGEIDAMSYAEITNGKWEAVSVPTGSQGAKRAIASQIEWLETFEQVVLMFDADDPGREAAQQCVELFSPGKCRIATLPGGDDGKDANAMLLAGRSREVMQAVWDAKVYRPDGIKSLEDIAIEAIKPVEWGLSWPWDAITKATYGMRLREVYTIGAGTGTGKTDFLLQTVAHLTTTHEQHVGLIFLEQPPAETMKRMAGKIAGKQFHVPDGDWTQDELEAGINKLVEQDRVVIYDHFGAMDWESVESKIRYMAAGMGCKWIILDHLTALAAAADDERKALEKITAAIAQLAQELNIGIFMVSHLSTPEGKSHEEGGRVTIRHFKGSRAIGYWSHFMFGLERNQQAAGGGDVTVFRVLKDRYTGKGTGVTVGLKYDHDTGLSSECAIEFADEDEDDTKW